MGIMEAKKKLFWQLWEIQEFTLCVSDSVNASLMQSVDAGAAL